VVGVNLQRLSLKRSLQGKAFAAIGILGSLCGLRGQTVVSVDETKIRAVLRNDQTTVTIPFKNSSDQTVTAQLTLTWVNTQDSESSPVRREIMIEKGASTIDTVAPIQYPSIWTRLRYSITPDRSEARTFRPIAGILSLSNIADYVFEVNASFAGATHRGSSITVHAEAVHPVSRLPLAGAEWKAVLSLDNREIAPSRVTTRQEGFIDFTFDIPNSTTSDPDEEAEVEVTATRGDFDQSVSIQLRVPNRLSGRLQTDKPIYQPGQVLHLRAVVLNAQGQAASGAKVSLRIEDPDNERVHTTQLVTSKFGVIQDDWALPNSAGLGAYQIVLTAEGDDDYQIASHVVRVSRYELPTFNVKVKPDRAAYLPTERAHITVTGAYLFGKPVPKGHVKLVRTNGPRWNPRTRKSESADETVAEGEAKEDGTFTAEVNLTADHEVLNERDWERFDDIHFAAYYSDSTSHRTEQRRFDLRITRDPIHVYLIRSDGGGSLPQPVYVSTSYADGRPASADVEIQLQGRTTRLHTNRYGVGKAELVSSGEGIEDGAIIRAGDAAGQTGIWKERYWQAGLGILHMEASHTIHRAGEAVTLRITSPPEAPSDQAVMVHAIAGDSKVATRIAQLTNHTGDVTFPYQPEFRRAVVFVAWNGVEPNSDYRYKVLGSKAVIFPDGSDITLTASTARTTYKPGEEATVRMRVASQDGKPAEAALALAVVDQAVLERAKTESDFGRRPWFACAFCRDEGEAEIGGVRLNDLYALKPTAQITPELDLVAEALVAGAGAYLGSESSETITQTPMFSSVTSQMERLTASLDRHYAESLEFPEDLETLSRILGREWSDLADPWGRPYTAQFSVDRDRRVVALLSSGPDKLPGTADDFTAGTIRRSYFTPIQHLIQEALRRQPDYPATGEQFAALLRDEGLLMGSIRDPWGTPFHVLVTTAGAIRRITLTSAGPDRTFDTRDDFVIATFSGAYFRQASSTITSALMKATREPQSSEEFRTVLDRAGIDVTRYRDAWGKPYRIVSVVSSRYADRINSTTTRIFGQPNTPRTEVIPVTQTFITFSLRSDGPDGLENTYDDFDIARFPVLLREESAAQSAASPNTQPAAAVLRGTGAISGTVTDPAGAAMPNVALTLFDAAKTTTYESTSDQEGVFHFTSVPAGIYSLRAASPGFKSYELTQAPVIAGKTTGVDIELEVGSVSESVTVSAEAAPLQTETASVSANAPMGTPRVREYFPETLVWLPEILTSQDGSAVSRFALADSVTTWKVAAFASTLDGRIAESETEFRAFQPFFLDFNPPQTLTDGDQVEIPATIRNYQQRAQPVSVMLEANDWSKVGSSSQRVTVPPNSSLNVNYVVQAKRPLDRARLRIIAKAGRVQDAVEKSARVHPDGQEVVQTFGDFFTGQTSFSVPIPGAAIANANRAELRIYPNIASLLLESSSAILTAPHGCAEQTVSAGYANLVALRFARAAGITNPQIEKRALANIQLAVDGLGAFRNYDGGVRYWATGEPDVAVTAYALNFLVEASAVSQVNKDDLIQLTVWLEKGQGKDGRWIPRDRDEGGADRRVLLLTTTVVRALASAQKSGVVVPGSVLAAAYHHIAQFTDQTDEPYMLANFVLAALDSGDEALLGNAIARLAAMAHEERGGSYWDMRTNSPFYGWGTAGRYETTGLAVSALAAWRTKHSASSDLDSHIRGALVFLLRGRDATGGWYSTQSTLRAMHAIADASSMLSSGADTGGTFEVRSNGRIVKSISVPSDPRATDPVIVDIPLSPGDNQISLTSNGPARSALVLLTSSHWLPWDHTKARSSQELRFNAKFDRLDAPAGEPVRCTVRAERVGFRGYGMMLAEIGLPPGADVDRSSLESVLQDGSIGLDHYEILPDRVVLYLWPKAGGSSFDFFLTARNAMVAKSGASVLFDYYNPEALSEIAPFQWIVK
jgi:hypothetical protein